MSFHQFFKSRLNAFHPYVGRIFSQIVSLGFKVPLIKRIIAASITFLILILNGIPASAASETDELPKCVVVTHCVRVNWEVRDIEASFNKAVEVVANTPRTKIVEQTDSYIHAEAKTKSRRYTDDLLLKALREKGVIQVRSESRVGIGDMGVNQKRVDDLAYRLSMNKN